MMVRALLWASLAALALAGCGSGGDGQKPPPPPPPNSGGTKTAPNPVLATEGPRVVTSAAEAGNLVAPFQVLADTEASAGKCLTLPSAGCDGQFHNHIAKDEKDPKRTAGSAELAFSVEQPGDYYLWIRKWWCCSCGDSFSLQVDEGKAFTFGDDGTTPRRWSWLAHKDADGQVKFKLAAGAHKLTFRNRGESGFRIDQVLFTTDPESKFVPQGKEQPPQKPKAPAGG